MYCHSDPPGGVESHNLFPFPGKSLALKIDKTTYEILRQIVDFKPYNGIISLDPGTFHPCLKGE